MQLRVLGPLEADDRPLPTARRDRIVLAALALRPGRVVGSDDLAEALWPDLLPPSRHKVVQGAVLRLRRALDPEAIESVPGGYRLEPAVVARPKRLQRRRTRCSGRRLPG